MIRKCVRASLLVLLITVAVSGAHRLAQAAPGGSDRTALQAAAIALSELRIEDASRLLEPVLERHPSDPDVLHQKALLAFHQGEYDVALRAMDASITAAPNAPDTVDRATIRALIADTRDATASFQTARSRDGRFVVRYAPGPDATLVPYALEALTAADRVLANELGVRVRGPIRLEIFPSAASLARVSSLTVEDIERTGTIALCKWDRLMITTPRALVRGYPWMDTIAHEYVHLVLSRATRDRAPVWLQEGVAKFLERCWRGERGGAHLDPASAALLEQASRENRLLPFDRLHPSIARLPSQQDAALAFAQVATFVETFYAQHGADGLRAAVTKIANGTDARRALGEVSGTTWANLEASWRTAVGNRPRTEQAPPRMLRRRVKRGEGQVDESLDVQVENARRFLRIGDLLFGRGHTEAASIEYEKAHTAAPDDPIVASRLGRASLAAGKPQRAIAALEHIVTRYPDHAPAHAVLASARLALGNESGARAAAREAIRLNPFDPQPHCDLALAGDGAEEQRREGATCRALGGVPPT